MPSDVERLRALLDEAREWVEAARFIAEKPEVGWEEKENLLDRIDAALAEPVRDDFRRGAEAMREAAASCVGSDTAMLQAYRSVLEGRIRALPIPEDK